MPQVLSAVEALATIGEITGVLRRVFGEYREVVTV
jgi:methylmalonyl-CoA mutase N-terminal domain/subunit